MLVICGLLSCLSCSIYSQALELNGGRVIFGQEKVIQTAPRWETEYFLGIPIGEKRVRNDLQFCFAERFNDGTIWLTHSKGLHGPDEVGCYDISTDNGQTWLIETGRDISGFITTQLPDGHVVSVINGWDPIVRYNHEMRVYMWAPDKLADPIPDPSSHGVTVNMAYPSGFLLHRTLLRRSNGQLLASGYGSTVEGNQALNRTFCLASDDNGISWYYKSTMAKPEDNPSPGEEGYCEPCLVELDDGSILSLMRTGSDGTPLMQAKSTDGGATWSDPIQISGSGSVAPTAKVLSNGTLVAASGRPGLYMLVDFTGTGDYWQEIDIWAESTDAYASILEVEPNKVMLVYAQSDFSDYSELPDSWDENKIVGQYIDFETIPEPASVSIVIIGTIVLIRRIKR